MQASTVDHNTLKHLIEAGAVQGATAVALGNSWSIVAQVGNNDKTLTSSNSKKVREFKRFETMVKYLRSIGIVQFSTDATAYDPEQRVLGTKRPDKAAVLKQAHAAVEHDKWFRDQVQIGLDEANSPNTVWLSHDEVGERMKARHKKMLASG